MAQSNVTIRMDEELKKKAEKLFDELGMNMTTALTIFTKTAVREQRIPFEISLDKPNAETIQAINDVNQRKNLSKEFNNIKELMEDLDA